MGQIAYIGNIINDDIQNMKKPIVICGAGRRGKKIYHYFERKNIGVKYFFDSNIDYGVYEAIPIRNLKTVRKEDDFAYIVSGLYTAEILNYLIQEGIKDIHVYLD